MKYKFALLILIIPAFVFGQKCKSEKRDSLRNYGYIPIDPIGFTYPIGYYSNSNEYFVEKENGASKAELEKIAKRQDKCFLQEENRSIFFSDIPVDKIPTLLPNETVSISVKNIKKDGSIDYLGAAAASGKNEIYEITADYIKFATVTISKSFKTKNNNDTTEIISYARVGVGLRLKANITTKKKGINVGNLFGLAIAASKEELYGSLTVSVIGLESKDITTTLPLPSEISLSSIATALQAMATIKSKLHDTNTVKIPQIISIRSVNERITENDLIFNTSLVLNQSGYTNPLLANTKYIENFLPHLFDKDCLKNNLK